MIIGSDFLKWLEIFGCGHGGITPIYADFFNANVVSHSTTPLVLTNPLANLQVITLTGATVVQLPAINGQTPAWIGRTITINNAGTAGVNSTFDIVAQDGSTVIYAGLKCGQTVLLNVDNDSTANGSFVVTLIPNANFFNANVVTHLNTPLVLTNPLATVQVLTLNNADVVQLPVMNNQTPAWKGRCILVRNSGVAGVDAPFAIMAQDGVTTVYDDLEPGQTVLLSVTDDSTANGSFITNIIPNGEIIRRGSSGGVITRFDDFNTVIEAEVGGAAFTAGAIGTGGLTAGFNFWLKNISTGNVTFTPTAPNLIDGVAVLTLAPNESAWILCTGGTWETISLSRTSTTIGSQLFSVNTVSHSTTPLVLTNPLANVQEITLSFSSTVQLPAMNGQTPAWKGRGILVRNAGVAGTNAAFDIVAQDGTTPVYEGLECGQTVLLTVTNDNTANGTFITNLISNGQIIRRGAVGGGNIDRSDYFGIVVEALTADSNFTASAIGTGLMKTGFHLWLKNTSTGNITFTPTAPNLIDGRAYLSLSPNESAHILCNGATFETISLSRLGDIALTEITGTSKTISQNNGYIANNVALVVFTLPTVAQVGSFIEIVGQGAGGWKIAQNSGQQINFNSVQTTLGAGGSLASTARYNAVYLRCVLENLLWTVVNAEGNLNPV